MLSCEVVVSTPLSSPSRMLWWLKIWMMYLAFVHQLFALLWEHVLWVLFQARTCADPPHTLIPAVVILWERNRIPKITTRRSVSWKVMAVGQRILDRRVLKIGSKRSKNQQQWGTFFGFDSQKEEATLPSLFVASAPPAAPTPLVGLQGVGGWWACFSPLEADCL